MPLAGGGAQKKAKLSHSAAPAAIVLDIEGTISPISFVADKLFPYARAHLEEHLESTFASKETLRDVALLKSEVRDAVSKLCLHRFCRARGVWFWQQSCQRYDAWALILCSCTRKVFVS